MKCGLIERMENNNNNNNDNNNDKTWKNVQAGGHFLFSGAS